MRLHHLSHPKRLLLAMCLMNIYKLYKLYDFFLGALISKLKILLHNLLLFSYIRFFSRFCL